MKSTLIAFAACLAAFSLVPCVKFDDRKFETTTEFESSDIPEVIPYTGGTYMLLLNSVTVEVKSVAPENTDIVWGYRVNYDGKQGAPVEFDHSLKSTTVEISENKTLKQRDVVVEFSSDSLKTWTEVAKAVQEFNVDLLPKNKNIVVAGQEIVPNLNIHSHRALSSQ